MIDILNLLCCFPGIHKDIWIQVKIGKILKDADVEVKKVVNGSKIQDIMLRIIGFALIDGDLLRTATHTDKDQRGSKKQEKKAEDEIPLLPDNIDRKKFDVGKKACQEHEKEKKNQEDEDPGLG
jgi:hypothetical protein